MLIATRADDAQANALILGFMDGMCKRPRLTAVQKAERDLRIVLATYRQVQFYQRIYPTERGARRVVEARINVRLEIIQVRLARCS